VDTDKIVSYLKKGKTLQNSYIENGAMGHKVMYRISVSCTDNIFYVRYCAFVNDGVTGLRENGYDVDILKSFNSFHDVTEYFQNLRTEINTLSFAKGKKIRVLDNQTQDEWNEIIATYKNNIRLWVADYSEENLQKLSALLGNNDDIAIVAYGKTQSFELAKEWANEPLVNLDAIKPIECFASENDLILLKAALIYFSTPCGKRVITKELLDELVLPERTRKFLWQKNQKYNINTSSKQKVKTNNITNWAFAFHGDGAGFCSAVFDDITLAEAWIHKYSLSGVLYVMPLNKGIYDFVIEEDLFVPKKYYQKTPIFIQEFGSAYITRYHYISGSKVKNCYE
jgi:hypothetical protein